MESYRRIRNTLRFLLANTSDFDPAKDRVAGFGMARDRPLRARDDTRDGQRLHRGLCAFDFHLVAQRLQTFSSEDLGGFWLDVLKDRLYTTRTAGRHGARRRRRCTT